MEEPAQTNQSQMMSTVKIAWVRHSMRNDTQSKGGKRRGGAEFGTWDSWVMMSINAGRELLEIFVGRFIGNT